MIDGRSEQPRIARNLAEFRFDVNLSMLFTEVPLLERPAKAAAAGFDAVELWWPFAEPVPPDRDLVALQRALEDAGTRLVALNSDAGNPALGDHGLLSVPAQLHRFRANLDIALGFAQSLGCTTLNAPYGNRVDGVDPNVQDELALENLALAARAAAKAGATVVIETLNSFDCPRYPLLTAADALRVIEQLRAGGVGNVGLLCDFYHLYRMRENLLDLVAEHRSRISHVQIADAPGRHQPGTGDIDFASLFNSLGASGYAGYVGCEYRPLGPSVESFDWLPASLRRSRAFGDPEKNGIRNDRWSP
jgi:hydroxypyruvate isomerase